MPIETVDQTTAEAETEAQKAEQQAQYEFELMMENGDRLYDLAMALSSYDPVAAKQSIAYAVGQLCGVFDDEEEGPCLHVVMDLAEEHMEIVQEDRAEREMLKKEEDKKEAGSN